MTNFTKQFKKLYAGKGTANGGLMLALEPQFLKLDEIDEIPIDTDFELEWTCSSKVGLVDVEIYLLNYLVNSYTDIDAQDKSATIKVEEGDAVMVGGTLRIVIKDTHQTVEDSVQVHIATPTITALTTDPASPEPATDFELSGDSTYLVGEELTLQYSTDDSTWLPLGVATVQGDGTWSKVDCQIADAGTYYLRAVYDTDKVESVSISVTVESGETYLVDDDSNILVDDDSNRLII